MNFLQYGNCFAFYWANTSVGEVIVEPHKIQKVRREGGKTRFLLSLSLCSSGRHIDFRHDSVVPEHRQSVGIDVLLRFEQSSGVRRALGRTRGDDELVRSRRDFGDEISAFVERMDVTGA